MVADDNESTKGTYTPLPQKSLIQRMPIPRQPNFSKYCLFDSLVNGLIAK